ncbi:hypothetical protein EWN99_16260 [Salmonella enterica]|nr:hypothetical protein [Salmonella enterica]
MNKISFIYQTIIQPGMEARSSSYLPQMLIKNMNPNDKYSLMLTVGIILDTEKHFIIRADVFFDNKSVITHSSQQDNNMDIALFEKMDDGEIITLSHLHFNRATFEKSGTYRIHCELLKPDSDSSDDTENYEVLHTMDSFFYATVNEK